MKTAMTNKTKYFVSIMLCLAVSDATDSSRHRAILNSYNHYVEIIREPATWAKVI